MIYPKSKLRTPPAPAGVKAFVTAKARHRREAHNALVEIGSHAPAQFRNDLVPIQNIVMKRTAELKPASRQVRRRDIKQNAKLLSSIRRFGICRPVLIRADGTIIEGHGLWEAAKSAGISEVPCLVIDHLDPAELRLLPIALNRLAETGAWDPIQLTIEFTELEALGMDLVDTGFEMAEIDTLMIEEDDGAADEEDMPLPGARAVSQEGDVWILGEHRLSQGDARDPRVFVRVLICGEIAILIFCDPPYNVPNAGHVTGNADHREFAMAHGEMSRSE